MTVLTEDQQKLFRAVSDRLKAFPDSHYQGHWYWDGWGELTTLEGIRAAGMPLSPLEMAECGTVACDAGHTVLAALDLGMKVDETKEIELEAEWLLGLGSFDTGHLFSGSAAKESVYEWVAEAADTGELPGWRVERTMA